MLLREWWAFLEDKKLESVELLNEAKERSELARLKEKYERA